MSTATNDTPETPVRLLPDVARQASRTLRRERESIRDYVHKGTDRDVVLKYEGAQLDPEDATDHMTSTAFFLSRIERSSGAGSRRISGEYNLLDEATFRRLAITLENDFKRVYRLDGSERPECRDIGEVYRHQGLLEEKTAGNPRYSMSLHLRGLAAALKVHDDPEALQIGSELARVLAEDLSRSGFCAAAPTEKLPLDQHIGLLIEGRVNWYITYLMVDALASWSATIRSTHSDNPTALTEALARSLHMAYERSIIGLSRMLALHSASHENDFDALELASCIAVLLHSSTSESLQDIQSTAIARRGIAILVYEFVHNDGTFSPKNPPLVDQAHTQLFVSSAEVAELAIDSARDLFSIEVLAALASTVRLICERSRGHRGWGKDGAGSATRASIFDACSSVAFLTRFVDTWERLQAESVGKVLGLGLAPAERSTFPLPDKIRDRIVTKTIDPIKIGRRDLASMSLLLYGAPGTAKTTIAKRIAAELGWPLLSLDPSKLMGSGVDGIAAEAESLFRLLPGLRDVVVLFDEFEGVFLNRASSVTDTSRFLTTAMLPRLHELRDAGKIVFIIATNDRDAIDPAAYRPGRIDEHIEVEAPDVHGAGQIVLGISKRTVPRGGQLESWEQFWNMLLNDKDVTSKIGGLTPAYLNKWVRAVAIDYQDSEDDTRHAVEELSELKRRHDAETMSYNRNRTSSEGR